jgi:hypothetical protein
MLGFGFEPQRVKLSAQMAVSMRARVGAGIGALAGLVAVAGMSFSPLVRSRVDAEARQRDLDVTVERIRPGWFCIVFEGIRLKPRGVDGVEVGLPKATLQLSAVLSPKEVLLHGGQLSLTGEPDDLKARILEWRSRRPPAAEGPHKVLPIHGEGLAARWEGGASSGGILGLEVTRDESGVQAAFEKADLRLGPLILGIEGGSAGFDASFTLKSLKLTRAEVTYSEPDTIHDGSSAATTPPELAPPPLPTAATAKGRKKTARRTRADDPPTPAAEASAPLVPLPDLHALRASGVSLATLLTQKLPEGSAVLIEGLAFRLERGGEERISLGPGPLRVERQGSRVEVTFSTGSAATGTPLSVHALLPSDDADVELSLAGGPVPFSLLGLRAKALTDLERATLAGRGKVVLDGNAKNLTFDGQLNFRGLTAHDPRLSTEPVRGVDFEARARGVLSDRGELRLDDAEAAMGALRVEGHGGFEQTPDHVSVAFDFDLPTSSCEAVLASIPTALIPTVRGAHMRGTFGAQGRLAFDTRRVDDLSLDYTIADRCHLTDPPAEIDHDRFSKPFVHRIYTPEGKLDEDTTGPTTDNWTELDHISPFMQAAVLTTEDGAFFHHHGFSHPAIRNALVADLKARRFIRGASTITMQLAKNLFLSRDKTLSRKLEELILTDYLEQAFTKDEMMELYLNIIEFGPNVYGVTAAADHYFGRKPEELNLAECMFLSSILPQPIHYHHLYEHGELPDSWLKGIRARMVIAEHTGKITAAELAEGLTEPIVFHMPSTPRPPPRPPVTAPRGEDDESGWQELN